MERKIVLKVDYKDGLDMKAILSNLEHFEPRFDEFIFTNDVEKIGKLLLRISESHYLMSLDYFGNRELGYLVPLDGKYFSFVVK